MKYKLLVTGGAGFIGSNFIHGLLANNDEYEVWNLDALTYAGNLENLKGIEEKYSDMYHFVKGDISDSSFINDLFDKISFDFVINFAAESHVDRSIISAAPFILTNILGTQNLLDASRNHNVKKYLQVSTDEVYGSLGDTGYFTEETPLSPNSPYSASKTSADLLVRAAFETFSMPVVTTRCSNNYGPFQFPEKLIPLMITNAKADKDLPVYGDGMNIRDWIHVSDHCDAILQVLEKGREGDIYNIGGNSEEANINIVKGILKYLKKSESLIKYVQDRPGHDRRYAIDAAKMKNELGWEPKYNFEQGLAETIDWYLENKAWWERIKTGKYLEYYKNHYQVDY